MIKVLSWRSKYPEAFARMAYLIERNHSAAEVAKAVNDEFKFSLTRNAVIGLLFRAGIKSNPVIRIASMRKSRPGRKKGGKNNVTLRLEAIEKLNAAKVAMTKADAVAWLNEIGSKHKCLLDDLEEGRCHWPMGALHDEPPYYYCGEPTNADVYCAGHATIGRREAYRRGHREDNEQNKQSEER